MRRGAEKQANEIEGLIRLDLFVGPLLSPTNIGNQPVEGFTDTASTLRFEYPKINARVLAKLREIEQSFEVHHAVTQPLGAIGFPGLTAIGLDLRFDAVL